MRNLEVLNFVEKYLHSYFFFFFGFGDYLKYTM